MVVRRHKQNVGAIHFLLFQSASRNVDQKISSDRKKSLSQRTGLKSADPILSKGQVLLHPKKFLEGTAKVTATCVGPGPGQREINISPQGHVRSTSKREW